MKILPILMCTFGLATAYTAIATETVNPGGLETIRGASTVDETRAAERLKRVIKDKNPIKRNYVHQPPMIPHQILVTELIRIATSALLVMAGSMRQKQVRLKSV